MPKHETCKEVTKKTGTPVNDQMDTGDISDDSMDARDAHDDEQNAEWSVSQAGTDPEVKPEQLRLELLSRPHFAFFMRTIRR
ncbi:hypothetical protein MRX96_009349 [Rhipicephalus microplus]